MRTHSITVLLLTCLLQSASTASAQELGEAGNLAFGVDRFGGFYLGSQNVEVGPTDVETDFTVFALGWNDAPSPVTRPRLTVDYFIDDNLTLGGSLGVYTRSREAGGAEADDTGLLFGLRVGYALRLSHGVSFWPRAGFSYTAVNSDGLGADYHLFALALDAPFTLAPAENWAFTLGPAVDIGIDGEVNDNDLSELSFGVMVGLLGWFST